MRDPRFNPQARRQVQSRIKKVATQKKKINERAQKQMGIWLPISAGSFFLGVFLLFFGFILSSLGAHKENVIVSPDQKEIIVGPYNFDSGDLSSLKVSVEYMPYTRNSWCHMVMLLLDENKNYISGGRKDTYYERSSSETYSSTTAYLKTEINKDGAYYFQLIPTTPKTSRVEKMQLSVESQVFGNKGWYETGIFFGAIGVLIFGVLREYVEANYVSLKWNDPYQNKVYKICFSLGMLIFSYLLIINYSHSGYAGNDSEHTLPEPGTNTKGTTYFCS